MTCSEVGDLLAAYGDHELSGSTARLVDEHLAGCASCRAALARNEALDARLELLRSSVPGPDIAGEVMRRTQGGVTPRAKPGLGWKRAAALPVALVVLLALTLSVAVLLQLGQGTGSPQATAGPPMVYALRGESTGELLVLDSETLSTVATVALGANPRAMTLSADGRWMYVAAALPSVAASEQGGLAQAGVWTIDLSARVVSTTMPVGYAVWDVAAGQRSGRLLLSYQPTGRYLRPSGPGPESETISRTPGQILELDMGSGKVPRLADVRPLARGLAVTPDGKLAYVVSHDNVNYDDTAVTIIDTGKRLAVATVVLPGVEKIAAAPDGRHVFVAAASEPYVWTIDRTGRQTTAYRVSALPAGVAVSDLAVSSSGLLLALATTGANGGAGGLVVLDTRHMDTLFVAPSAEGYQAVAFSDDGKRVYAATASGRLDVLSVPGGRAIATVEGLGNIKSITIR